MNTLVQNLPLLPSLELNPPWIQNKRKVLRFLSISGCTVFPAILPHPPPQPTLLPHGKVKNVAASVNGAADLPRASQELGARSLTGGLRPLLPQLSQRQAGCPVVPRQPGCSLAAPPGSPARPVCEPPLVGCGWQGVAFPPPFNPLQVPLPSVCSSVSQKGRDRLCLTVCYKERAFDSVPHPLSGGTTGPRVRASSRDQPAYLLVLDLPQGARSTPQPDYSLIPTRVPGQSHLAVERCTDLDD